MTPLAAFAFARRLGLPALAALVGAESMGLPAGTNRMRWRTFLAWNALGGVVWAVLIGLLGFFLRAAAERLVRSAGLAALAVVAATVLVAIIVHRRRRRRSIGAA